MDETSFRTVDVDIRVTPAAVSSDVGPTAAVREPFATPAVRVTTPEPVRPVVDVVAETPDSIAKGKALAEAEAKLRKATLALEVIDADESADAAAYAAAVERGADEEDVSEELAAISQRQRMRAQKRQVSAATVAQLTKRVKECERACDVQRRIDCEEQIGDALTAQHDAMAKVLQGFAMAHEGLAALDDADAKSMALARAWNRKRTGLAHLVSARNLLPVLSWAILSLPEHYRRALGIARLVPLSGREQPLAEVSAAIRKQVVRELKTPDHKTEFTDIEKATAGHLPFQIELP